MVKGELNDVLSGFIRTFAGVGADVVTDKSEADKVVSVVRAVGDVTSDNVGENSDNEVGDVINDDEGVVIVEEVTVEIVDVGKVFTAVFVDNDTGVEKLGSTPNDEKLTEAGSVVGFGVFEFRRSYLYEGCGVGDGNKSSLIVMTSSCHNVDVNVNI